MIRAEVRRRAGEIVGLRVTGHADTAPMGQDLVCAAVSAIVQTACLALARLDPAAPPAIVQEGDVRWHGPSGETGQTILRTCLIGLEDIARDHPQALRLQIREETQA